MKLSDGDWKNLLPGEAVQIGSTVIDIAPLTLEQLAKVIRRVSAMRRKDATEDEIIDSMIAAAPDILEICTGLEKDDIRRLPAKTAFTLIEAVYRINKISQEGLLKNFRAAADVIRTTLNAAD